MSAIKIGAAVTAADMLATMRVEELGPATASGPIWICVWTNLGGRECRRGFLESSLTLAPRKKRGGK